jgi:signal transduction histidine kinase
VEDNGIGITDVHRDKIFDAFVRLHGKEQYPGSGIGLTICKKIIERHGGDIEIESILNQGTKFIVTLPLRQPAPAEHPIEI